MDNLKFQQNIGLGIRNINNLSESLNGYAEFNSNIGTGTTVEVTIYNTNTYKEELLKEEVV